MPLIVSLFGLWIVLSVLALGFIYIGSDGERTEGVLNPEDWETFDRR